MLPNRLGWILMESPAVWWVLYLFFAGSGEKNFTVYIILGLWMLHYIHRTLIYPFRTRTRGKKMPVLIALSAFFFQMVNGFFNGWFWGNEGSYYPETWIKDPRFIIGLIIFLIGLGINFWADKKLLSLRKPGETTYKIPFGGLFTWISCPNFFGEIIEWLGFAILCWNLPALSFFIWTAANLIPRAWAHHKWYQSHFSDYPKGRKALFPYLF